MPLSDEQIAAASHHKYELIVGEQAGARDLLVRIGALEEIEIAVIAHCQATAPNPTYRPQAIKRLLGQHGWIPEVRVPPYDERYDDLPINDRYDLYKVFDDDSKRIGIAIEIERWEVWTDLLKFRRGIHRGQIVAGVVVHDNPESLTYVFDHLRLVSEPLFGDLPILFAAPSGKGLQGPCSPAPKKYKPYLMPGTLE